MPSNYPTYSGETNPEDPGTKWYQSGTFWKNSEHTEKSSSNYYSPSPYTKNGTPNSLYRATEYSGGSLNNALSYFEGRKQTDAILEARGEKDYSSWKPDSGTPEDFPVVSCCDIYHTVGTNQGDWYLPSQAELGYVVARLDNINSSIAKIGGMLGLATSWSWSSTVFSSDITRTVAFFQGLINQFTLKNIMNAPAVAFTTV